MEKVSQIVQVQCFPRSKMVAVILSSIALILFMYAFYKWATANNEYFANRNIKFMRPKAVVGNFGGILLFRYTAPEVCKMFYEAFPNES